jgi:hypothetical protein
MGEPGRYERALRPFAPASGEQLWRAHRTASAESQRLASIHRPNLSEAFCWPDPTDVILMVVTGVAVLPLTLLRLVHRS